MTTKNYDDGGEHLLDTVLSESVSVSKRTHLQVVPGGKVDPPVSTTNPSRSIVTGGAILEIAGGSLSDGGGSGSSGLPAVFCQSQSAFLGITGNVTARDGGTGAGAAVEVDGGGAGVFDGMELVGGVGVTGGGAGLLLRAGSSRATVHGGTLSGGRGGTGGGSGLIAFGPSSATILGGALLGGFGGTGGGNGVMAFRSSVITISGGSIVPGGGGTSEGYAVMSFDGGKISITGGSINGTLVAYGSGATIDLHGENLTKQGGRITGTLQDGTPISATYIAADGGKIDLFNKSEEEDPEPVALEAREVEALEQLRRFGATCS